MKFEINFASVEPIDTCRRRNTLTLQVYAVTECQFRAEIQQRGTTSTPRRWPTVFLNSAERSDTSTQTDQSWERILILTEQQLRTTRFHHLKHAPILLRRHNLFDVLVDVARKEQEHRNATYRQEHLVNTVSC